MELTIKCDDASIPEETWHYSGRKIEADNVINFDLSETAKEEMFKRKLTRLALLQRLKRLKVCSSHSNVDPNALFPFLYRFKLLEQFECELKNLQEDFVHLTLSHPNLKSFKFTYHISDGQIMDIDAEQLEVCYVRGFFDQINFTHPESIVRLNASMYLMDEEQNLSAFVNLEELICHSTALLDSIVLSHLPKLKILTIMTVDDGEGILEEFNDYENLKRSILSLIQMKQALDRKDLTFYFDDQKLVDAKQFLEILREDFYRWSNEDREVNQARMEDNNPINDARVEDMNQADEPMINMNNEEMNDANDRDNEEMNDANDRDNEDNNDGGYYREDVDYDVYHF